MLTDSISLLTNSQIDWYIMTKEYSPELQKLFLEMMLQDAQSYVRVQNIYNPENFDRSLR